MKIIDDNYDFHRAVLAPSYVYKRMTTILTLEDSESEAQKLMRLYRCAMLDSFTYGEIVMSISKLEEAWHEWEGIKLRLKLFFKMRKAYRVCLSMLCAKEAEMLTEKYSPRFLELRDLIQNIPEDITKTPWATGEQITGTVTGVYHKNHLTDHEYIQLLRLTNDKYTIITGYPVI